LVEERSLPTGLLNRRILLDLLLPVQVGGVVDDLDESRDPAASLLLGAGDQVQVLAAALEDDGEAARVHRLLRVLLQALRMPARPHRRDVVDGDWRGGGEEMSGGREERRRRRRRR